MKMKYSEPEFEVIELGIRADILTNSDPAPTVPTQPGGGLGPGDDPWGSL